MKPPLLALGLLAVALSCQQAPEHAWFQDAADARGRARLTDEIGRPMVTVDVELFELPAASEDATGAPGDVLTSPRLSLFEGQRGTVSVINQTAYVSHFEVETSEHAAIADPIVKVFEDGVLVDVVVMRQASGYAVGLGVNYSELQEFVEVTHEVIPDSMPVTIQVPISETRAKSVMLHPNPVNRWFVDLGQTSAGKRLMLRVGVEPLYETEAHGEHGALLIHPDLDESGSPGAAGEESSVPFLSEIPILAPMFEREDGQ